ncbi:MAG: radical SAM family heme chaperone HemW [Alphaproteobacteria bacterium]
MNNNSIKNEQSDGFGIYIHWPFCLSKCPYCDFNSHVRKKEINQNDYCNAIFKELDWFSRNSNAKNVSSIFFGGGTPSLMSTETVNSIIDKIYKTWSCDNNLEITLEANPTSVEAEKFLEYSKSGVNRVSLGIQSLVDDDLKKLGRQHTVIEALNALHIAKNNFSRVSFDLIYARPHQDCKSWERELKEAISYNDQHLSLYQLTIEPGTRYADLYKKGKLQIPDDMLSSELYNLTNEICKNNGLVRYEVSNFSSEGQESIHNLIYWQSGQWAGIGPGAHSRINDSNGYRHSIMTEHNPEKWLDSVKKLDNGIIRNEILLEEEIADEYLLMSLRTRQGLNIERYKSMGRSINDKTFDTLKKNNFIKKSIDNAYLQLTEKGFLFTNKIITELCN